MRRKYKQKNKSKARGNSFQPRRVTLDIQKVGAQGDGIGYVDDQPVYVPYTMAGDIVTATITKENASGATAELVTVDQASEGRIDPVCQHFTRCGGCQLQMMSESRYVDWIMDRVSAALAQHDLSPACIKAPSISPLQSRRRVALKVIKTEKGVIIGFNARASAEVINIQQCPVTLKSITDLLNPLRQLFTDMLQSRSGGTVHLTETASGIDMVVDIAHTLNLSDRELLTEFASTHDIAAIHWIDQGFQDPVLIRRHPVMKFGGYKVALPPANFIQATNEGETILVSEMLEALEGHKRMADLFCGLGTFTVPAAQKMQVLAVEGAKLALDSLQKGLDQIPGQSLKKVITKHRDLFRRPLTVDELSAFDAVVFDPPRSGAKEQVLQLARSNVETIVGISCNPNTFCRDARILVDGGYRFESIKPVDQFLYSAQLELVGVFKKD